MRFEERELNVCEKFFAEISKVTEQGKKLSVAYMTPAEFDEFYQIAMNTLNSQEASSLMMRKIVNGVQIIIEEPKKVKKDK